MPNYKFGKIFVISSKQTDLVYYGATTMELKTMLNIYKYRYNKWVNIENVKYNTSFEVVCYPDCKIYLIEYFPCGDIKQLNERKRFWIENNHCINKNIPGRSDKEYAKEYRQNNKDKISKDKVKYYQANKYKLNKKYECPCGGRYTAHHITEHVQSKRHEHWVLEFIQNDNNDEDATVVGSDTDATI